MIDTTLEPLRKLFEQPVDPLDALDQLADPLDFGS
jgi:hypothetical protein